ncbi:MAG: cupin domain-containing protein [Spirochaetaceae bacterium]|nr:cupin domain-containing protein [Spirochaetaceae bacterium]
MALQVYDYRSDIANLLVTPQIRCRFLKMAVGQFNAGHTHDLGHEIFLILQGRAEFEIDGERAVLGPGELCIALTDQYHTVRNVGDDEVVMFLSVTPHIQPTHTFWDEDGSKQPPRFASAAAYDQQPDRTTATAELAARQAAAAASVTQAAAAAEGVQREQLANHQRAVTAGDEAAAHAARNAMWEALSELFGRTMDLAGAWNNFAARSEDSHEADGPAESAQPGGTTP